MSCGIGHRRGSDPTLLWLWHRLAAVALIRPLAWEPLYAVGVALKRKKKKSLLGGHKLSNTDICVLRKRNSELRVTVITPRT